MDLTQDQLEAILREHEEALRPVREKHGTEFVLFLLKPRVEDPNANAMILGSSLIDNELITRIILHTGAQAVRDPKRFKVSRGKR